MGLKNLFSRLNTQIWAASLPREPEDLAAQVTEPLVPLFEFTAWPKTPRLLRDIVITEKLDGTNGGVLIKRVPADEFLLYASEWSDHPEILYSADALDGGFWVVGAQSRNRVITRANDNQGFAKWVQANASTLIKDLGEGVHFGEFWGNKIGRGYGLPLGDRRFSLFNPDTFARQVTLIRELDEIKTPGLSVVPVLYSGPFDMTAVRQTLIDLRANGSTAAPGYLRPEGIIVYHTHARRIIGKVTLDNQDAGKWES